MNDDEKARRLKRLRAGYDRWRRAMNGESLPEELPDIELTLEDQRRIAKALSFPEPAPSGDPPGQRKPR